MRIDIPASDAWTKINDRIRSALVQVLPALSDDALQVQTYAGYEHALYEATQGLARLFSHKKTVAFLGPLEPSLEALAVNFSEETYTVKILNPNEDLAAQLAPLMNELVFVAYSADHPVTGRLFDGAKLEAALKDKRVFRVILSHARHLQEPIARPALFEARVLSVRPDLAVVLGGERFRVVPSVAKRLPWRVEIRPETFAIEAAADVATEVERTRQNILGFETSLPKGFHAYFQPGEARLFDRAVFYSENFDGWAVADYLAEELGLPLGQPGDATPLDSTSACRWANPKFSDWLLNTGEKPEVTRGLVVMDAGVITERTLPALIRVAEKLTHLQSG